MGTWVTQHNTAQHNATQQKKSESLLCWNRGKSASCRQWQSAPHLEAMDQVVSGEKLVKDKLERVVSAGFVQRKHIEGPSVHMLENTQTNISLSTFFTN